MQRHLRLRRQDDFAHIRHVGQRYQHSLLTLSVAANDLSHNRYGFITSKRLGNAVVRNRMRRILRAVMHSFDSLIQPGYDLVIVARPAAVGQPFRTIHRIIEELLVRSGLMRVESDLL